MFFNNRARIAEFELLLNINEYCSKSLFFSSTDYYSSSWLFFGSPDVFNGC